MELQRNKVCGIDVHKRFLIATILSALPMERRVGRESRKAFSGNGNQYKDLARIAELERLLGQAHAEIEL